MATETISPRKYALKRKTALENERSSWLPELKDVSENIVPWRGRFTTTETNRNQHTSRLKKLYDSTGTRAHAVLEAGLMSGNTSPARPWFRLKTPDATLNEFHSVKEWLDDSAKIMRTVFSRANTYKMLRAIYAELGAFGVGVAIGDRSYNTVIHHNWLTAGEYCLAANQDGKIDTIMREYAATVEQVVNTFGLANVSDSVKHRWERFDYNSYVDVIHLIEPRRQRNMRSKLAKDKAFKSCYYEAKGSEDKVLRESGYDRFPGLAPRWGLATSTDVYCPGPGAHALPHVKELQHLKLRKAQAVDYLTKPPLQMPSSMASRPYSTLPGGITFTDDTSKGVRTQFETRLDLSHLQADIADIRAQIKEAFFYDLFLMLANDTRSGTTAHEIALRHEEKLLMLGPVLENLYGECLQPLVEDTFVACFEAGVLPPPPSELNEQDIQIEFVSTLAQAQRTVGVQALDRVIGTVANIAAFRPEAADKLDVDKAVDEYADAFGVDPSIIVANDKVAIVRKARDDLAAAQNAAELATKMPQAAGAVEQQGMPPLTGYGGTGL